ncbi:MAG: hypothetical protein ACK4PR_06720 [Gammaproteobacteria bacterium]
MQITRPLGYSEVVESCLNLISPHNIVITGEINKLLDKSVLKKALQNIKITNPMLNLNVTTREGFYDFNFVDEDSEIRTQYYKQDDIDIEKMVSDLISYQLTMDNSPLAMLVQVECKSQTILFMVFQHLISDGISAMHVFLELIEQIDIIMNEEKPDKILKVLAPALDDFLYNEKIIVNNKNFQKISYDYNSDGIRMNERYTGVMHMALNLAETEHLLNVSKAFETTATSTLSALISKIMFNNLEQMEPQPGIRCKILVNLRQYLNNEVKQNDLGFYSGCIKVPLYELQEISKMAKMVQYEIKEFLDNGIHLKNSMYNRQLINESRNIEHFAKLIEEKNSCVGLSNMGIIQRKNYKNFELLNIHIACDTHIYDRTKNNFFVCANTYKGELKMNFLYPQPVFTNDRMITIISQLKDAIRTL